jgi:hypothetical protein
MMYYIKHMKIRQVGMVVNDFEAVKASLLI